MGGSFRSASTQCVNIGTPDQYGGSTASETFQDVSASTNASADENRNFTGDAFSDGWESLDCREYGVQISRSMVGNDNPVNLVMKSFLRVFRMEDALEHKFHFRN